MTFHNIAMKFSAGIFLLASISVAALFVLCPAVKADTFTETYGPTYDFDGVIAMTGLIPTCGAFTGPCVETIDLSFEYFTDTVNDITNPPFTLEFVDILGGESRSATGALGSDFGIDDGGGGFVFNTDYYSYIELHSPAGTSYPNPEIDLNADAETNTFWADTYTCLEECEALFGGTGIIGSVPTTLQYSVSQVPETPTSILILCGLVFLGILHLKARCPGLGNLDT